MISEVITMPIFCLNIYLLHRFQALKMFSAYESKTLSEICFLGLAVVVSTFVGICLDAAWGLATCSLALGLSDWW